MKKIKIGILGVSNHFIKRIILPASRINTIEIYAIASRSKAKVEAAAKLFNIPVCYDDYQSLLDDTNVDIVYIPLPNHLHAEWIKKAADAGKHILAEKPLCLDAQQAQEVIDYVQAKGVHLMEAFMYKFHPQWQFVRDIIRTNNIGKVTYIHSAFSYTNTSPTNIRNVKAYGGGGLMDIGCYAISVPRFILGEEPIRVVGNQLFHPEFGTDVMSTGILDFGNCQATFTVSTLSEAFQKVDIVAESGVITVHLPFNTYADVKAKVTVKTALGEREVFFDAVDQYGLMIEAFVASIYQGGSLPSLINDAIQNQIVMDAIVQSAHLGSWQTISND